MEIKLRPWIKTDAEHLAIIANNYNIAKFMMNQFPHPYTIENAYTFIEMSTKSSPSNILAIDLNGIAIGGIGVHLQSDIYCKNAELGYWLAEEYWGKGYITTAILLMINYAFDNFDIERIYAKPFGSNKGSKRVLEKTGFVLEAHLSKTIFKNNVYEDELIYAVRRKV
ncbi:MAG: GNAT family N-acetyltransferase [Chitinophagaceae bacterium]|nr:GNAT family N-acetyltransferase [Chitinophagaceae bacterium]